MDRQSLDRVFAVTKFYHLCVISLPQMSTELLIGLSCNHLIPCRLWYFLNVIIALRIKDCIPAMVSPLTERYAPLLMIMCKVTQYLLRWGLSIYTCTSLTQHATPFICFTMPHPLCHTLYMFYRATPFICFTMPHPLYVLPCHTLYMFYHATPFIYFIMSMAPHPYIYNVTCDLLCHCYSEMKYDYFRYI